MAHPAREAPPDQLSGRLVADRYELGDMLGRGGFGAVYEGHDRSAGEAVAVKVFRRSEGLASRAQREARTASKLAHPNVQSVRGVAQDEEHAYLVSELVVGERFDRTELSDDEAVRAIAAVADALAHAHARGVVHRDVKPGNILVSVDGDVRLTDFGIARDEDARDQTMDERVLGTLSYMSPEQAQGKRATGATDVWAAGLTLYARLTGRNPYRAKSLADLLERLSKPVKPLAAVRPDLPAELSDVLGRALQHDPGRRPDAAAFRDGLLRAIRPESEEDEDVVSAPVAAPPRPFELPQLALGAPLRAAGAVLAAGMLAWALTAFPVYPPAWTLPAAALVGALAWWRAPAGLALGAVLLVPAFWNHAEAAGIAWIALAAAWTRAALRWEGPRALSPLVAGPLALVGLGPAYVVVAATAPTPRRRLAEGLAGGVVCLVTGNLVSHHALHGVAGADSPAVLGEALLRAPAALALVAAMGAFAVLLPVALEHRDDRRLRAVVAWGLGFGLAVAGLPQLVATRPGAWVPAAGAALLAAIIPAAWALASPRLQYGR